MYDLISLLRRELINRLGWDERGVVYVEYALLIALIALVVVAGAAALGNNINGLFARLANYINTIPVPSPPSP
jgi:pilus assembly protein Flp/PilA